MLEYLFDPKYKSAKSKYDSAKKNIVKLNRIKNDLTNDTSSISSINKKLDYVYEDFKDAVLVSDVRSRVYTKINGLKEPHQTSDGYLVSAVDEINDEIRVLKKDMQSAENRMDNIKNNG